MPTIRHLTNASWWGAVAFLIPPLVLAAHASAATFNGLGDLPGGNFQSAALGVSDNGLVVVGEGSSTDGPEAFRWTRESGMVGLGGLPEGGFSSRAHAASADGSVVVGTSANALAFRWTAEGGMVRLAEPISGYPTIAYDVSPDGSVIVGVKNNNEGFRWTEETGTYGIGLLDDTFSVAFGVSADGLMIVGYGDSSVTVSAFEFHWNGYSMGTLADLPGGQDYSVARAVSADGSVVVVVGEGWSAAGPRAVRWTPMAGADKIFELGESGSAYAVSADGLVVVGEGGNGAFIWDATNGSRAIKDVLQFDYGVVLTDWSLRGARGISADGRTIVGYGTNPSGFTEAWIAVLAPACSDGFDNDGDGLIDYPSDPQCGGPEGAFERRSRCGLGFELALVLPLLVGARRARQRGP